jgi:hypothetical protein
MKTILFRVGALLIVVLLLLLIYIKLERHEEVTKHLVTLAEQNPGPRFHAYHTYRHESENQNQTLQPFGLIAGDQPLQIVFISYKQHTHFRSKYRVNLTYKDENGVLQPASIDPVADDNSFSSIAAISHTDHQVSSISMVQLTEPDPITHLPREQHTFTSIAPDDFWNDAIMTKNDPGYDDYLIVWNPTAQAIVIMDNQVPIQTQDMRK